MSNEGLPLSETIAVDLKVERATVADAQLCCELIEQIFPEEEGKYLVEYYGRLLAAPERDEGGDFSVKNDFYIVKDGDKPIGIRWVCVACDADGEVLSPGVAYVPYGGIIEEYRSKKVYTRSMEITEEAMRESGVGFVMNDCEDPNNIPSYVEEEDKASFVPNASRRLKFFTDRGYRFFDTRFTRPGGDPEAPFDEVVDYYVLGVKSLREALPADGMPATQLKELYLLMMGIDRGLSEDGLQDYVAVKEFLKNLSEVDVVPYRNTGNVIYQDESTE